MQKISTSFSIVGGEDDNTGLAFTYGKENEHRCNRSSAGTKINQCRRADQGTSSSHESNRGCRGFGHAEATSSCWDHHCTV